jgi:hypothetical protein
MYKGAKAASGLPRYMCRTRVNGTDIYCYSTTNPDAPARGPNWQNAEDQFPKFRNGRIGSAHTLLITTAQSATPINVAFWTALKRYARKIDAEIVVIPLRYSNPTSIWSKGSRSSMWWDENVVKHLHNERTKLNKNLTLLADINVLPTAQSPLTGMEGFTGASSGILGHTRAQTVSVATPGHKMSKLMTTTGACTKQNFIPSRAGKSGEHHFILGALIVELEGDLFWCRRLNANSKGEFIDGAAGLLVTPKSITQADRPLGLELGDTHHATTSKEIHEATFGPEGIVHKLKPRKIMFNDLLDGQSCNPHEAHDPFLEGALATGDRDNVELEVKKTIDYLAEVTPSFATSYIKISNHDDFLRRWVIKNTDWAKVAVKNRRFLLRMASVMEAGATLTPEGFPSYPSPFPYCVEERKIPNVVCLKPNESLVIGKYECQYHGHKGGNGAIGSLRNLSRIGVKTMIAHGHGPGEENGSMQVGHSAEPNPPYASGAPSSWLWAHGLIMANGKAQLVIIVNGRSKR